MNEACKSEKEFWSKKSRIARLKEGDRNTKYFYAMTTERRKRNRIDELKSDEGVLCSEDWGIVDEIAKYFKNLFTIAQP